jgi:hypothetical protein
MGCLRPAQPTTEVMRTIPRGLPRRLPTADCVRYLECGLWRFVLERAKGIEPSYAAWEAAVLPLNYARVPASVYQSFGHAATKGAASRRERDVASSGKTPARAPYQGHPSTASMSASCCGSGIAARVSLRNFSAISASDANDCSLPRGASRVSTASENWTSGGAFRTIRRWRRDGM